MTDNTKIKLSEIIESIRAYSLQKMNKMKEEQKKKIEYVIGIDLGHGETSAAICPMQWDTAVEQLDPAKDLDMGGNKKVMPSAITILDNGNAYIGDAAFNPEILKQAEVRVCFKLLLSDKTLARAHTCIRPKKGKETLSFPKDFVILQRPNFKISQIHGQRYNKFWNSRIRRDNKITRQARN